MSKRHKKTQKEVIHSLPFPDLRIDCYGKHTYVYLDGVDISSGITKVKFKAVAMGKQEPPVLDLKLQPHATFLEKVKPERIDTALETSRHQRIRKKIK